jgi:hypothetical protein
MDFIAGIIVGVFIIGGITHVNSIRPVNNGWIQCKLRPEICDAKFAEYQAEIKLEQLREKIEKQLQEN